MARIPNTLVKVVRSSKMHRGMNGHRCSLPSTEVYDLSHTQYDTWTLEDAVDYARKNGIEPTDRIKGMKGAGSSPNKGKKLTRSRRQLALIECRNNEKIPVEIPCATNNDSHIRWSGQRHYWLLWRVDADDICPYSSVNPSRERQKWFLFMIGWRLQIWQVSFIPTFQWLRIMHKTSPNLPNLTWISAFLRKSIPIATCSYPERVFEVMWKFCYSTQELSITYGLSQLASCCLEKLSNDLVYNDSFIKRDWTL